MCRVVRKLKSCHRIALPSQTTLFQAGEFAKIVLWVLVVLGSRDRAPFCLGFVSVIYLLLMFHVKNLTPL